jgi:acetyltransferase-like isoleucine patch superfamily enzyme
MKNIIKKILYEITNFLLTNHRNVSFQVKGQIFKSCGDDVSFSKDDYFTYKNISIGNSVLIGSGAVFIASKSEIIIGNKVLFGPGVTVIGGNHTFDRVGVFIYDITDETKDKKDDVDILIEDDVWIGANTTILKGVKIGRGSVVGAGSLVVKSLNPYSIAVGVPAKEIKRRFTIDEILLHEKALYPNNLRFSEAELEKFASILEAA